MAASGGAGVSSDMLALALGRPAGRGGDVAVGAAHSGVVVGVPVVATLTSSTPPLAQAPGGYIDGAIARGGDAANDSSRQLKPSAAAASLITTTTLSQPPSRSNTADGDGDDDNDDDSSAAHGTAGDGAAHGGGGDCAVCMEAVGVPQSVWQCRRCYVLFHLACMQSWVTNSIRPASRLLATMFNVANVWHCPVCRAEYGEGDYPSAYRCYCGKVRRRLPARPRCSLMLFSEHFLGCM